ncbi:GIY-YIG nuclease family protein [candidate division KSB1 bacterium]|nr:GIY-YIG nuclease family protein [candidate division KSB1 bacterium]
MSKTELYYVYFMANWNNRVLYIGVTNSLERRYFEHKYKITNGFTAKYNVNKLVYFEEYDDIRDAIAREKQLKKWRREKKNKLVESMNPGWNDLLADLYQDFSLRSK